MTTKTKAERKCCRCGSEDIYEWWPHSWRGPGWYCWDCWCDLKDETA